MSSFANFGGGGLAEIKTKKLLELPLVFFLPIPILSNYYDIVLVVRVWLQYHIKGGPKKTYQIIICFLYISSPGDQIFKMCLSIPNN
jgi:hypothetical protein